MCDRSVVCQSCVTWQWFVSYVGQAGGLSVLCERSVVGELHVSGNLFISYI